MNYPRAMARNAGFTLIEMLVVLLVLGLLAGLASSVAGPDERGALRVEAERLAQLLDLAATESRLSGRRIAWTASAEGYRFWHSRDQGAWLEMRGDDLLRARALPPAMRIASLRIENTVPQHDMRLHFAPDTATQSFQIELTSGRERVVVTGSPAGDVRADPVPGSADAHAALP